MIDGRTWRTALALPLLIALGSAPAPEAAAQPAPPAVRPDAKPVMTENCPGLVAGLPPFAAPVVRASLKFDQVRISFAGHATFLIETPRNVKIATDYNDYVRPRVLPDIVTMNHAHSTHYTDHPDPGIRHVLRGWGPSPDKPARHDLSFGDVRVRNVPTNIRTWSGETERHGNSVFVFEIAGLCIAHLGHLHHTLTQPQLDEIGRVDVVMVPVDGGYTLDHDGMVEVLKSMKAPLMIPMHYFSTHSLRRFLDRLGANEFQVEYQDVPVTVVSRTTLPDRPTIRVLPGR